NGSYLVRVEKPGFTSWEERVAFAGNVDNTVTVNLDAAAPTEDAHGKHARGDRPHADRAAKPAKAPSKSAPSKSEPAHAPVWAEPGQLQFNSQPGAGVWLDGRDTGHTTPLIKLPVPAGAHRITLRNPRYGCEETIDVDVQPGSTSNVFRKLACSGAQ